MDSLLDKLNSPSSNKEFIYHYTKYIIGIENILGDAQLKFNSFIKP